MMKACKSKNQNAEPEAKNNLIIDDSEDVVIGVGQAPVKGDEYILDGIDEDYDPIGGARLVVFAVGVSAIGIAALITAALIRIFH